MVTNMSTLVTITFWHQANEIFLALN